MPTFIYKAKDRSGNTVNGSVDALTERDAASSIREQGLFPMDIRLSGGAAKASRPKEAGSMFARYFIYPLWTGVNIKMLALFYRQMATMLASGMSLSEALTSVRRRMKGRLAAIVDEAIQTVAEGEKLSGVIERHPRVFSSLQLSLIRVAESGGLMEPVMDRMASYLEYELSIRRMISKNMTYPVLVLIFAYFVSVSVPFLPLIVTGSLMDFLRAIYPGVSKAFYLILAVVVACKLIFQFYIMKMLWDGVKIRVPFIGDMARKIAMSRFSRALALLYASGIPIADSVSIGAEASANICIANGIKRSVPALQAGQGLLESLTKTGAVSPMVLDMIATGERSGNLDFVLNKVSEYMEDETDASLHKLGIILFILLIIVAGISVGIIVLQFYIGQLGNIMRQGGM